MKWSEERDPSTNHLKYHLANFTTKEESEANGFTVRRVIGKDLQKNFFFWTNQFDVPPTPLPSPTGPADFHAVDKGCCEKRTETWIFYGQAHRNGGGGSQPPWP